MSLLGGRYFYKSNTLSLHVAVLTNLEGYISEQFKNLTNTTLCQRSPKQNNMFQQDQAYSVQYFNTKLSHCIYIGAEQICFLSAEQYVFAQRRPSTNQWSIYSFSCFSTTYTLSLFQRQFVAQLQGTCFSTTYVCTQTSLLSGGTATGCKSTYTTQQLLRALFAAQYNSVPLRVVSLMRFWIIGETILGYIHSVV